MPGKCKYKDDWTEKYGDWIGPKTCSVHTARCKLCRKDIDISNMGEAALKSHMQGKKHLERVALASKTSSMKDFITTSTGKTAHDFVMN